jgi:DedD protein
MPEPSDTDFDALKRKARRRLVGAVVLALAAAVFVPMLLESEQKPLGDDVSVHIPPVDDGKFVNRLNAPGAAPATARPAAPATPAPPPATPDSASSGAATKPADTPQESPQGATTPPPAPDNTSGAASPTTAATATAAPAKTASATPSGSVPTNRPAKSLTDAEHRVLGAGGSARTAAPSTVAMANDAKKTSAATPADIAAKPAAGGASASAYVVQLAAFSDDKGANALSNRLKKAGYAAYTEPVTTSHGTLWRVRVGPFGTRDDANATRDRLKHEGYSGLVATNPRTT